MIPVESKDEQTPGKTRDSSREQSHQTPGKPPVESINDQIPGKTREQRRQGKHLMFLKSSGYQTPSISKCDLEKMMTTIPIFQGEGEAGGGETRLLRPRPAAGEGDEKPGGQTETARGCQQELITRMDNILIFLILHTYKYNNKN